MRCFSPTCLLLFTLPLLGQAQSAPPVAPAKRYFAGLDGSYSAFRSGFGWDGQGFAPTLVAGLSLQPRLALHLGLTASQRRFEHVAEWVDRVSYTRPFPIYAYYQTRLRTLSLPVLLRYDLGRQTDRRLQVQALGGLTLQATRELDQTTLADSTGTVFSSASDRHTTFAVALTVGPGLRYTLGPHVELTAHALLSVPLRPLAGVAGFTLIGSTSTVALGARYYLRPR